MLATNIDQTEGEEKEVTDSETKILQIDSKRYCETTLLKWRSQKHSRSTKSVNLKEDYTNGHKKKLKIRTENVSENVNSGSSMSFLNDQTTKEKNRIIVS